MTLSTNPRALRTFSRCGSRSTLPRITRRVCPLNSRSICPSAFRYLARTRVPQGTNCDDALYLIDTPSSFNVTSESSACQLREKTTAIQPKATPSNPIKIACNFNAKLPSNRIKTKSAAPNRMIDKSAITGSPIKVSQTKGRLYLNTRLPLVSVVSGSFSARITASNDATDIGMTAYEPPTIPASRQADSPISAFRGLRPHNPTISGSAPPTAPITAPVFAADINAYVADNLALPVEILLDCSRRQRESIFCFLED